MPDNAAVLPRFCSKCGSQLVAASKFCQDCGQAVNPRTDIPPKPERLVPYRLASVGPMVCGVLLLVSPNMVWATIDGPASEAIDEVKGMNFGALVLFLSGLLAVAVGVLARKRRLGWATRLAVAAVALFDLWLLVDVVRTVYSISQVARPVPVHLGLGVYVGVLGALGVLVTLFSERAKPQAP